MTGYWVQHGWIGQELVSGLRLVAEQGRWASVQAGVQPELGDLALSGLALPGLANTHSHAFHRALRGRTHDDGGTFWTWRERMYELAGRLEPESYLTLARAVYAEMALAGVSAVGEFHYLHHGHGATRYPDPNAFGHALIQAAAEAGVRITLLDTCYLAGGLGPSEYQPLTGTQLRFGDGDATGWRDRVNALAAEYSDADRVRIGAAIHSVRAVPADQLATVLGWAGGRPLHVHVSEQPAENEATQARYGCTPTELLARHGFGGPLHTAVHATHLTEGDIAWYGSSGTNVSVCPTTERDLADGIGPTSALAAAGAGLSLGSDQNAVIDLLEEARALELDDRLATLRRGRFALPALVGSLTVTGQHSLGWSDAGRFAVGGRADLVTIRLDTVRTAGSLPRQALMAAGTPDIDTVITDGQPVVSGGRHRLGDVGTLLAEAIEPLWPR